MKKSTLKFDSNALKKQLTENLTEEQTRRLIAYAKEKIQEIGDKIQTWGSKNHMDRTGNLLNSLCWGVAYSGKLIDRGFYRDEIIHSEKGATRDGQSYLHEWFAEGGTMIPVQGRALAEKYIKQYGAMSWNGRWKVFFGVLAPYWGYWEEGFRLKGKFLQFNVMTQFFDKVTKDLKPAKVTFKTESPKYATIQKKSTDGKYKAFDPSSKLGRRQRRYEEGKYDPYKKYNR